jgi:hypothetical protein
VRGNGRTLQGYNAQAATTTKQVVVAAELTQQANDLQQLAPMLAAICTTLTAAGISGSVQRLAADSGYWSIANVSAITDAPELLIPPARHGRHGKPRKDGKPTASKRDSLRAAMLARLGSEQGKACYAQRSRIIEPVFGQVKTVQGGGRFMRRGAAGLPGRVEAAVRYPQPAQALARDHGRHQLTGTNHQAPPATLTRADRASTSPPQQAPWPSPRRPAIPLRNRLVRVNGPSSVTLPRRRPATLVAEPRSWEGGGAEVSCVQPGPWRQPL